MTWQKVSVGMEGKLVFYLGLDANYQQMVVVLNHPATMLDVGARKVVQALQFNGKQGVGRSSA